MLSLWIVKLIFGRKNSRYFCGSCVPTWSGDLIQFHQLEQFWTLTHVIPGLVTSVRQFYYIFHMEQTTMWETRMAKKMG